MAGLLPLLVLSSRPRANLAPLLLVAATPPPMSAPSESPLCSPVTAILPCPLRNFSWGLGGCGMALRALLAGALCL